MISPARGKRHFLMRDERNTFSLIGEIRHYLFNIDARRLARSASEVLKTHSRGYSASIPQGQSVGEKILFTHRINI